MSLRVNGTGQVLHAYVNGKYIGMCFILLSPNQISNALISQGYIYM